MTNGDMRDDYPLKPYHGIRGLEQNSPGVIARHTLERGAQHLSLDLGDFDGDGLVDIVTTNSLSGGSGVVEVWRNHGPAR